MSGLWMLRKHFVLPEALPRRPQTSLPTKIHAAILAAWLLAAMTLPSTGCCGGGLQQEKTMWGDQSPALDFTNKQIHHLINQANQSNLHHFISIHILLYY